MIFLRLLIFRTNFKPCIPLVQYFMHSSARNFQIGGQLLLLSLIHISEPTRLLSISYAVFCLKKKKQHPI